MATGWWAEVISDLTARAQPVDAQLTGGNPAALLAELQAASASVSGVQPYTGQLTPEVEAAVAALSGDMSPEGVAGLLLREAMFGGSGGRAEGGLAASLTASGAAMSGEHTQAGLIGALLRATSTMFAGAQRVPGSVAPVVAPLSASFSGGQQQSGTLAADVQSVRADFVGQSGNVVTFDAAAVLPSASTSQQTTWQQPADAGAYVLTDVAVSGDETVSATYEGDDMDLLDSLYVNDGNPSYGRYFRFGIDSVGGGPGTVAVTKSGFNWIFGGSVSLLDVASVGATTSVNGSGTSLSHGPITCPVGGLIVHGFVNVQGGIGGVAFTDLSGGITRIQHDGTNEPGLAVATSDATTTFTATIANSRAWAGINTVFT